MVSFTGEFPRQLDERGRFILPAKIREKLSGTVYITKAPLEKCLYLYTEEEWQTISQKMAELPASIDINVARFTRIFFSRAMECELDKQGRIPLTPKLLEAAGLKKDIVLSGSNTKIEIWDADEWSRAYEEIDNTEVIVGGIKQYDLRI